MPKLPKEEIKELFEIIKNGNPSDKVRAVQRLGRIRREECVEPLLYALKDEYYLTRMVAVQSLSWIADERMIDPLIEILLHDENPKVRFQAAEALAPLIQDHPKILSAFRKVEVNGLDLPEFKDLIKTVLS